MFLILLSYTQPLATLDALLPEHRAFLQRHYAQGHFLLSGRQEPRTGGVIMAQASHRAEIESWIAEDPFQRAGAARYDIIEFVPTMAAGPLQDFITKI